jgi:hypothetical protein
VLVSLDLSANELTRLPAEIGRVASLQNLDLRDNDLAELPPEVTELGRLRVLRLEGNAQLQTVASIASSKGVSAVFDYLRDLHDDPQPTFKLKVLLAGPSMAGKTSVKNRLMGRAKVLADADTERTIGLDIASGVVLPDPQGRAPHGIILVVYDAGGHDEYQEMQQVFVTPGGLCVLMWNVAKRAEEGEDEEEFVRKMVAEQVHWAQIIQSCAPGSTVSPRLNLRNTVAAVSLRLSLWCVSLWFSCRVYRHTVCLCIALLCLHSFLLCLFPSFHTCHLQLRMLCRTICMFACPVSIGLPACGCRSVRLCTRSVLSIRLFGLQCVTLSVLPSFPLFTACGLRFFASLVFASLVLIGAAALVLSAHDRTLTHVWPRSGTDGGLACGRGPRWRGSRPRTLSSHG